MDRMRSPPKTLEASDLVSQSSNMSPLSSVIQARCTSTPKIPGAQSASLQSQDQNKEKDPILTEIAPPNIRAACFRQSHPFRFTGELLKELQEVQQMLNRIQYAYGDLDLSISSDTASRYLVRIEFYHRRL